VDRLVLKPSPPVRVEDSQTIEDVYEPYLLQIGLLQRTPRGRLRNEYAYKHLQIDLPKTKRRRLILVIGILGILIVLSTTWDGFETIVMTRSVSRNWRLAGFFTSSSATAITSLQRK